MIKFKFLLCCLILVANTNAKNFLFRNGKSDYSIVVPLTSSPSEKQVASELKSYIKQISGVSLTLMNHIPSSGHYIYVGYNNEICGVRPKKNDETFTYRTKNGNLYIWGGSEKGTMYGVYSFLENELGVRWYTSDFTKVPKLELYTLPLLNHTESPCIQQRLDFYYAPLDDALWRSHNKLNVEVSLSGYGNTSACYGVHTMLKLVPPENYAQKHPEYYSLREGKRQYDHGQLCLSNKDVLEITQKAVLKIIAENPEYNVIDVSQDDNLNFCQCDKCMTLANKYGGQSGIMIWFVNQVADAIRKPYPGKKICTFAYKYTRHAPVGIKPRSNVEIRLCDIECCFSHPLASTHCDRNKAFMNDLKAWNRLTNNIYIWDYVVNFPHYLVPYPNIAVLKDNIQTLKRNSTICILEEGAYNAQWAEFSELRAWLLAKLLWNPNQDVWTLIRDFCNGYYGKAGNDIYEYLKMTQDIPKNVHVLVNTPYEKECFNDIFLSKSLALLEKAMYEIKGDHVLEKRISRVLAQVYYTYSLLHFEEATANGIYQRLKDILSKDPTITNEENKDIEVRIKEFGYT